MASYVHGMSNGVKGSSNRSSNKITDSLAFRSGNIACTPCIRDAICCANFYTIVLFERYRITGRRLEARARLTTLYAIRVRSALIHYASVIGLGIVNDVRVSGKGCSGTKHVHSFSGTTSTYT